MKTVLKYWLGLILLIYSNYLLGQALSGQVLDISNQSPVPFAYVVIQHTQTGTITNNEGKFSLSLPSDTAVYLIISSIGYRADTLLARPQETEISILLHPTSSALNQILISGDKKVSKDTAAIRLYRRIVKNKPVNSMANVRSYQFKEYEKSEFAIENVKRGIVNKTVLKRASVLNDYMDSTANGTVILPVLLKERLSEVSFRRNPIRKKVVVTGERFDGIEDYYKLQLTEGIFEELDIYQNIIRIQNKGFISPFAENALPIYKYFISDTMHIQGERYIVIEFTPRRKGDLAFIGTAVIHDESAAIYLVDVGLIPHANLNFVSALKLKQEYQKIDNYWFKKEETFTVNMNLTGNQKHQNVRIIQTRSRSNIKLDTEIDKSTFKGQAYQIDKAAWYQNEKFWKANRSIQLTGQELGVSIMLDSLKRTPVYKRSFWLAHAIRTGFLGIGPIEIGRWESLYSFNAIEGNRFKFGIRNNQYLFKQRYDFNAYMAYGDKDKLLKYHFSNEFTINQPDNPLWSIVGAYYRYDWSYDYSYNQYWSYDRIFQSITRLGNPLNNLFLIREGSVYFEKEVVNGVFGRVAASHKTVYSWPSSYQFIDPNGEGVTSAQQFSVVDFHLRGKLSLPSRTKEQQKIKSLINFDRPYLEVNYHFSPMNLLGSNYTYQLLKLAINQKFNSPLGRSIVDVKTGKLFGTVPFPLLEIHQGNESIGFNQYGYNLLNDYEYASDTWGELWLEHHFDGLIFNLLPFNKHLKIRSLVSFKALTGSLTASNEQFLLDAYELKPVNIGYLEMGIGFENIARAIRVDLLWRVTQRNLPETRIFGIRWQFKPSF